VPGGEHDRLKLRPFRVRVARATVPSARVCLSASRDPLLVRHLSFRWSMYRRSASSSDASGISVTWSGAAPVCFSAASAYVAHLPHRQDDEGEGRQEGSGAADSHQSVGELGPAVRALDPATDALLDGALGLVHESRRLRRGAGGAREFR
jgi:hypothetical protein